MASSHKQSLIQPGRPVLLIGRGGTLGRAWAQLMESLGIDYRPVSHDTLDLTRPDTIAPIVEDRYGVVVNCAAYTAVDKAESEEQLANQINGHGLGALAHRCRHTRALLVNYSTDYVFNGHASAPYPVDAPIEPLNAYGRSKALGEKLLADSGCRFLNIRTSWLYAPWGTNFVRTIAGLLRTKEQIKVVDDQRGRPTSAEHLAKLSLGLIQAGAQGMFHGTDGGQCTWREFAAEIGRVIGSSCRVDPCSTDQFPRPAKRPAYSVMDLTKTEAILGPMPDWTINLTSALGRLEM